MEYRAENVAACILNELGSLSTMKLQKLVFYSQALYLVQLDSPLFPDRIEAWANGPVVPALFDMHRGRFVLPRGFLGTDTLGQADAGTSMVIGRVLEALGSYTGAQLSELTHSEAPWQNARAGLSASERSNREITRQSIREFYSSVDCRNPLFA